MPALLDPSDDSELTPATKRSGGSMDEHIHIRRMGSPRPEEEEEEEPLDAQLAALHKKTFIFKGPLYTDLAIFTPFGRKRLKAQKFRVHHPLGDGSYIMRELPGPQNLQQWLTSWRLYKAACLMLRISSLASLQIYEKAIERLVLQWPRCWGLIYQAEDIARAERLDKTRRKLRVDTAKNQIEILTCRGRHVFVSWPLTNNVGVNKFAIRLQRGLQLEQRASHWPQLNR